MCKQVSKSGSIRKHFVFTASATISDDETEKTVDDGQKQFERHKFPRDSGCFASSSPASDRSSQQSHSESGIHDFEMDHESSHVTSGGTPVKRAPERSAQARTLRDRHTLNTHDLQSLNLNKDSFEVLVEKYVTEKTPLQVEHGRVRDARSIFEGCN